MTSPFAAYAAGFLVAIAVYSLGFSDLYPPLETSLVCFLLATCAASVFLARVVGRIPILDVHAIEPLRIHTWIFLGLMMVFVVEIVVSGGLPIFLLATGGDFDYLGFGIPTVHVVFVGFAGFYSVYWFDLYMLGRGRSFLILALTMASTSLLIVNRGGFIIAVVAMTFVYLKRRGFNRKLFLTFAAFVAAILWGFGLLGDLRTHGATGESIILSIGEASDRFVYSNIPTELFWPYLYISSPLANLQLNVTNRTTTDKTAAYFELEFLPDFVSERIVTEDALADLSPQLIKNELSVSSMYGRAFMLLGWTGVFLSFAYFSAVTLICLCVLSSSKYYIAAASILSSLAFLNMFDNMYIFAGGITQVIVALLLRFVERRELSPQGTLV